MTTEDSVPYPANSVNYENGRVRDTEEHPAAHVNDSYLVYV